MKIVIATQYGSPDVLQLKEVAKPVPRNNEVLIRQQATVVGSSDIAFRTGDPFIARLFSGLTKPRFAPGDVLAGEIEAVGSDVTLFKPGDQVFGSCSTDFAAYAEYKCLPENGVLAIKPTNMTYEEAASICDGAPTALTFLRDKAKLQRGQKVLINGASGAVGAAAVQLARYYGGHVTGVCSTANVDMVKSLGADKVIDYTSEDFTSAGQAYDIIFDAVGKSSFSRCQNALTPGGVYLTTVPSLGIMLQMLRTSVIGSKKARFVAAGLEQSKDNLHFLKERIETRALKAVIDRTYPLQQIVEAHGYVEAGHKKGSVVIKVAQS
jgi:NADPH:quinone reductase-like Zn-dependent oxidoreductase